MAFEESIMGFLDSLLGLKKARGLVLGGIMVDIMTLKMQRMQNTVKASAFSAFCFSS